ncbi:hypothetical protein OG936_17025 [Streptomyces sp. NBC_00846]|uniref:hypothetical protein n=1 Tax=Streptomyces sp. NBC_00846 TaxID=2975849 RepID=UPI0038706AD9|nr:hypothetical protein OG936_17025 [Streptomyces sp. NBC_00846]
MSGEGAIGGGAPGVGVGTAGRPAQGAIDRPLAVPVGVPEPAGVLRGGRIARALPTRDLNYALVITLFALAPYLALHS